MFLVALFVFDPIEVMNRWRRDKACWCIVHHCFKHVCSHTNTWASISTAWPPVPQRRERERDFCSLTVCQHAQVICAAGSTQLSSPPADQPDICTRVTLRPHLLKVLYTVRNALLWFGLSFVIEVAAFFSSYYSSLSYLTMNLLHKPVNGHLQ